MKKLTSSVLCIALLLTMVSGMVGAASITLPDGGSGTNTGCDTVYGRSSGGSYGYATLTCTVTVINSTQMGSTSDYVRATTKSNVSTGLTAYIHATGYYAATTGGEQSTTQRLNGATSIPTYGLTLQFGIGSDYSTRASAGHSVKYTNYGSWICGTAYTV